MYHRGSLVFDELRHFWRLALSWWSTCVDMLSEEVWLMWEATAREEKSTEEPGRILLKNWSCNGQPVYLDWCSFCGCCYMPRLEPREELRAYQADIATVLRNGCFSILPATDLVPGDIVEVSVGCKIPADMRMIEMLSYQLRVDQAILTGESCSVGKELGSTLTTNAVYQDKTNILFSGTVVVAGRARAVVVGVGSNTAMGNIRDSMLRTEDEATPLKKKLDEFGTFLAKVIAGICVLVWLVNIGHFRDPAHGGFLQGAIHYFKWMRTMRIYLQWRRRRRRRDLIRVNLNLITNGKRPNTEVLFALAVAAIPEGLPAVVTTLHKNRFIAKFDAVKKHGRAVAGNYNKPNLSSWWTILWDSSVVPLYSTPATIHFPQNNINVMDPAVLYILWCLALGTKRMARMNAIVRSLPSVETLGCTTVICSDKTGTLTTNMMSVSKICVLHSAHHGPTTSEYSVSGTTYAPEGFIFDSDGMQVGLPGFDSMPSALNMLSKQERASYCNHYWEDQFKKVSLLEFSHDRMMTVLCSRKQMEIMFSTGAPESIISRCTSILCNDDGSTVPLTANIRTELESRFHSLESATPEMTMQGCDVVVVITGKETLRCLALALKRMPMGHQTVSFDDEKDLTFVGLRVNESRRDRGKSLIDEEGRREEEEDEGWTRSPTQEMIAHDGRLLLELEKMLGDGGYCMPTGIIRDQAWLMLDWGRILGWELGFTAESLCQKIGAFDNMGDFGGHSYTASEFEELPALQKAMALQRMTLVEPSHKRMLVEALQHQNEVVGLLSLSYQNDCMILISVVKQFFSADLCMCMEINCKLYDCKVAMTGDGAPALKKADIGIAMGSGTAVAKTPQYSAKNSTREMKSSPNGIREKNAKKKLRLPDMQQLARGSYREEA
ncbi:hypothetical protein TEA_019095 [Camellia sinensis var. sinensis]|uniref:P-type ATPase A domain-containing protein n=1 Tax=Camellia sinensis var. sinensis TaxID=542762 RepID=A0A4S4DY31_CAMSN|nr:hypothetical protein TEA_019095 [Camellia sinensis var. sinensis]